MYVSTFFSPTTLDMFMWLLLRASAFRYLYIRLIKKHGVKQKYNIRLIKKHGVKQKYKAGCVSNKST